MMILFAVTVILKFPFISLNNFKSLCYLSVIMIRHLLSPIQNHSKLSRWIEFLGFKQNFNLNLFIWQYKIIKRVKISKIPLFIDFLILQKAINKVIKSNSGTAAWNRQVLSISLAFLLLRLTLLTRIMDFLYI